MAPDITLGNWLAQRAARGPHRRAVTFEGSTLTYGELQERIDRLAAVLRDRGVRPGDRVGYLGLNHPAFLETLFAAARLGAIFVPLNFRLTGPELRFIINDAGCHTVVADDDHRAVIDSVRTELVARTYLGAPTAPDGAAAPDRTGPPEAPWEDLGAAIAGTGPLGVAPRVDADAVAVIMYTSGTTGEPKGAMLTHANLWWNNTSAMHAFDVLEDDVSLVFAPMFHIGGLNVTTLVTLQRGGELVVHRGFDPTKTLEDIPRYGVTTVFGVPAMFLFLSQHPGFDGADLTSLRMLVVGGAPVPEPLMKLYNGRGVPMNQGYGLTETAPTVTFLTSEHALDRIGSAGLPPIFGEVRITAPDGTVITEADHKGEVCYRGANVMKGYWNRPEATAAAIDPEGWFHTGDVGYLDRDGFLYIADRVKDMVISGGENVYPAEVESVLFDHPAVSEVAVIGLPDERWGEAVTAVVALAEGATLTLDELRDHATDRLARYKLPTRLHIVEEIPHNASGKVLKRALRDDLG